jgi:hypothetical protein
LVREVKTQVPTPVSKRRVASVRVRVPENPAQLPKSSHDPVPVTLRVPVPVMAAEEVVVLVVGMERDPLPMAMVPPKSFVPDGSAIEATVRV